MMKKIKVALGYVETVLEIGYILKQTVETVVALFDNKNDKET